MIDEIPGRIRSFISILPRYLDKLRQQRKWLRLSFLAVLAIAALLDFFFLGLARRTFVFYDRDSGVKIVEERNLKASSRSQVFTRNQVPGGNVRSLYRELDITRYVEEAILGPASPDSLPLFPKDTRLRSLLYRDGVVYADLSENAALPPPEGGEVFTNLETLRSGIQRNFPSVKDVRFFIAGKAAYRGSYVSGTIQQDSGLSPEPL